jgi:hypothetical protein
VPDVPPPAPIPAGEAEPAPIEFGSTDPNEHKRSQPQNDNSVFVCNLQNVKKEELQAYMEKHGPVFSVVIHTKEGNSTDYAFVNYKTPEGPKNLFAAIPEQSGHRNFSIDGNPCVMEIQERKPRDARGPPADRHTTHTHSHNDARATVAFRAALLPPG